MKDLLIKICGLRHISNIRELAKLEPDFMGFIFHGPSPRHALPWLNPGEMYDIPDTIIKTGVFVDKEINYIKKITGTYTLNAIQLHGHEKPEICKKLKDEGITVLKAFGVDRSFNFEETREYTGSCDYFIFDTKTPKHGGSGHKFNWDSLNEYHFETPFLLSGGISPDDAEAVKKLQHPSFSGIDLNSRFEISPGIKDTLLIRNFLMKIKE